MTRVLITGGAGFVGSHFVEHFLKNTDWEIVVLDRLNYSGSLERLEDIKNGYEDYEPSRVTLFTADFTLPIEENLEKEIGQVDYIFHIGAESHVDNSITDPVKFVKANVLGTQHMIDFARRQEHLKCFFYFSTDEVFGSIEEGFSEVGDPHYPSNPYAATKSGGEMLVKAAQRTYGLPAIITRTMNILGERQHPEKYVPLCIRKIVNGETITIHANADKTQAGKRMYIHARNVADAYLHLVMCIELERAHHTSPIGKEFHIVGEKELDNLELAQMIGKIIGKEVKYEMVDFHSSRPGHDLRYALSGKSMEEIGWKPPHSIEESLEKLVKWTLDNPKWYEDTADE